MTRPECFFPRIERKGYSEKPLGGVHYLRRRFAALLFISRPTAGFSNERDNDDDEIVRNNRSIEFGGCTGAAADGCSRCRCGLQDKVPGLSWSWRRAQRGHGEVHGPEASGRR